MTAASGMSSLAAHAAVLRDALSKEGFAPAMGEVVEMVARGLGGASVRGGGWRVHHENHFACVLRSSPSSFRKGARGARAPGTPGVGMERAGGLGEVEAALRCVGCGRLPAYEGGGKAGEAAAAVYELTGCPRCAGAGGAVVCAGCVAAARGVMDCPGEGWHAEAKVARAAGEDRGEAPRGAGGADSLAACGASAASGAPVASGAAPRTQSAPMWSMTCYGCGDEATGALAARLVRSAALARVLGALPTACTNVGCAARPARRHAAEHAASCPEALVPCGNSAACAPVRRAELREHEAERCPHRLVACSLGCGARVPLSAMPSHLADECMLEIAPCRLGCGAQVARGAAEAHEAHSCQRATVICGAMHPHAAAGGLPRCAAAMPRMQLAAHRARECKHRDVPCGHDGCDERLPFALLVGHEEHCGKRLSHCPLECGAVMPAQALSEHMHVSCPNFLLPCKYAAHGCTARIPRSQWESHLAAEAPMHLALLEKALMSKGGAKADADSGADKAAVGQDGDAEQPPSAAGNDDDDGARAAAPTAAVARAASAIAALAAGEPSTAVLGGVTRRPKRAWRPPLRGGAAAAALASSAMTAPISRAGAGTLDGNGSALHRSADRTPLRTLR